MAKMAKRKKSKAKERKRLTNAFVRKVTKPGKYYDRYLGLMLQVFPSGAKCWQQCIMFRGTRRTLGLGGADTITLAEAREAALQNKRLAQSGEDPLLAKHDASVPTFKELSATVLKLQRGAWTGAREEENWRRSLELHVFPHIGSHPVSDIRTADVLKVLEPIWNKKPSMAQRVRHRIGQVMIRAVAVGYRSDNPAGEALKAVLPRKPKAKFHPAVPHEDVRGVLDQIDRTNVQLSIKLALKFLVLTAARSGEVRGARWDELDLVKAVWTVPPERMKNRKEHEVPLSPLAIEILEQARSQYGESALVFPSTKGKELTPITFSALLHRLNAGGVPHGFRSSFRDWCADTSVDREAAEACLAHALGSEVEKRYRRTIMLERRRTIMHAWAEYLYPESRTDSGTTCPAQSADQDVAFGQLGPPEAELPEPAGWVQGDLLEGLLAAGDD